MDETFSKPRHDETWRFPPIEPYRVGLLPVSDLHRVHFNVAGDRHGRPVVVVHGGPGSGHHPSNRRLFDPDRYRIILYDQRGAGQSTPHAELKENDTWRLIEDMEALRLHLGIEKWLLYGGSWGSTLCLAYAISHPDRVAGLILRGIFTCRKSEVRWLYQEGASKIFPDHWEGFVEPIPEEERGDLVKAYYKRLSGSDEPEKLRCATAWSKWECSASRLHINQASIDKANNSTWALAFARLECHYFVNDGFFPTDSYILDNVDKLRHLPCTIIQGRYDIICPMATAYELHKKWPEATFEVAPDAGHSRSEPSIMAMLVKACADPRWLA